MPKIDQDQSEKIQQMLLSYAKKSRRRQDYVQQYKAYREYFKINPTSKANIQIFQNHLQCLKNLGKKHQLQITYEYMLKLFQKQQNLTKTYIKFFQFLMQEQKYQKIQKIFQSAEESYRNNFKILAQYIRACSRSRKYVKALYRLDKYRQRNNIKAINNASYWYWKIQLNYTLGRYNSAYEACNQCFSLRNSEVQYYSYNKCEICLILHRYEECVSFSDIILQKKNLSMQRKMVTKIFKTYGLYKLNKKQQALNIFEELQKCQPQYNILQYQLILLSFFIRKQNQALNGVQNKQKQLQQNLIKVLNEMKKSCEQQFYVVCTYSKYFFNSCHLGKFIQYFSIFCDFSSIMVEYFKKFRQLAQGLFLFTLRSQADYQQYSRNKLEAIKKQILGFYQDKIKIKQLDCKNCDKKQASQKVNQIFKEEEQNLGLNQQLKNQ